MSAANDPQAACLVTINLIARDIEALGDFYRDLFGYAELAERRTAIYRCLDAGGIELGFNAWSAYELLQLQARQPGPDSGPPAVTAYCTFAAASPAAVDALAARCLAMGGGSVRPAMVTHYGAYQVVLADPQQHVFRIQCPAAAAGAAGAAGEESLPRSATSSSVTGALS